MAEGWDRGRVLALAPDASSLRAAQALASSGSWPVAGAGDRDAVWGECQGSAAAPYRTAVDLSGPVYRCSCPSRKFPCKHALALLLLWSDGGVANHAAAPDWAATWFGGYGGAESPPVIGGFRGVAPPGRHSSTGPSNARPASRRAWPNSTGGCAIRSARASRPASGPVTGTGTR